MDELNKAMLQFRNKGLIASCQLIFATHSPFIVQNLRKYNSSFTLVRKENNRIYTNAFTDIRCLSLPNRTEFSFNLIMYLIFGIPTVELHNELYGELQVISGTDKEPQFDNWLSEHGIAKNAHWVRISSGVPQAERQVTLQTYIRNTIHHPENRENSLYTDSDLKKSIDEMMALLFK